MNIAQAEAQFERGLSILEQSTAETADEAMRLAASYPAFCRAAWGVLEPTTPLEWNWHHEAICDHVSAFLAGDIQQLLINVGPGSAKSTLSTKLITPFAWILRPSTRWLFASATQKLSTGFSVASRRVIRSEWYQARFGNRFKLTGDQDEKMRFENDRTGYRIALSAGGGGTGERGTHLCVDDLHEAKNESNTKRESVIDWYTSLFSTRQADVRTTPTLVIGHRVAKNDLSQHLIDQGGDWVHLCLPTEYDPRRRCVTVLKPGHTWEDPRTVDGEPLDAVRMGPKQIAKERRKLGTARYEALHQQAPTNKGGNFFKLAWMRRWKFSPDGKSYLLQSATGTYDVERAVKISSCRRFATMDVAGTEESLKNRNPDYSVVQLWDVGQRYEMVLVDQWRGRVEMPELLMATESFIRRHQCPALYVEINNLGKGVVPSLQRKGICVQGVPAKGDKETRATPAAIRMEDGQIYFSAADSYVKDDLEPELLKFPGGAHDDQCDALAYAALHVQNLDAVPIEVRCFSPGSRDAAQGWKRFTNNERGWTTNEY